MIGLVEQNIEFTLKKDGFLHYLKPKQPFGSQVRKSALSRIVAVRCVLHEGQQGGSFDICQQLRSVLSKFKEPRIEWNSLDLSIYIDDVQEVTHLGNCGNRSFRRPRHHTGNVLNFYNFTKGNGSWGGQVTLV